MTDDDKQGAEPDPWAGLDAEPEGNAGGDDAAFIFDMLGDGPDEDAKSPADQSQPTADDEAGEIGDIPLAVFPPPGDDVGLPDGDAAVEHTPGGSDRPEIISLNDASGFDPLGVAPDGGTGSRDDDADAFDDAQLARELAFSDAADERPDFGDLAEPSADDVSFNASSVPAGDVSPFADVAQADTFPSQPDVTDESVASIPIAATAMATAALASPKKKKSGIGQLIGVAMGGVMALPITYAILIWGFQKDPFKLAREVPDQMAFLVPQSLRQGARPARPERPESPVRSDAPSLDDLSTAVPESMPDAAPSAPTEAMAADGPPAEPNAPDADQPASPAGEEAMADDAVTPPRDGEPKQVRMDAIAGIDVPPELAEEFRAALATITTADEFQAAIARLKAPDEPPPMVPAEPDPVVPAEPAAAAVVALDLNGVEAAALQATESLDALESVPDRDDPARKRLMVGWYRKLAKLGEQCALLETAAADSGHPLEACPEAVDGLLERIRGSDIAVEDLRMLGRMWLAAQKRRADGAVLVATVESTRQIGPYWSTRVNIAGTHAADRGIAVISRMPPIADIGDQVIVTGVLFDADTVWASDIRPLAGVPASEDDMPAIGVPPTFVDPTDAAAAVEPPMLEEEAPVKVPTPAVEPPSRADGDAADAKVPAGDEPAVPEPAAAESGSDS